MARIQPLDTDNAAPSLKEAFKKHVETYSATITNMKATLGHSPLAFEVYMQWYPLYEKVQEIVGKRSAYLFAWSISSASNCPLCSTFFRRIIKEEGGNPDYLILSDYEQKLLDFGSAIAMHKGCIANHVYNSLASAHTQEEMILLTAFAGQMIATNVFNNTIETDIDGYLIPYLPTKYCYERP